MKILLFSGSLRKASWNKKLVAAAAKILAQDKTIIPTVADLQALEIPVYDGDIEEKGIPEGVRRLGEMISAADALVISSPEYNGAMAGSLKNAIDWVSRLRPVPLAEKPVLLMGASPGYFGTIRALGFSKAPFEVIGCFMYPQPFALPKAGEAFTAEGDLADEATKKKLTTLLNSYLVFAKKFQK